MVISHRSLSRWLVMGCGLAALAGCGSKSGDEAGAAAASGAGSAKPAPVATAGATGASAASGAPAGGGGVPADWADVDMTPAGKAWVDFTLKAPKGAKVKKGFPDPTIEAGDEYAVQLSFTHNKKSTAALDTARGYGVSWRALTDTPELFEYETSGEQNGEKFVRYNFDMFIKVDGKAVGCSGVNNQKKREQLASMMAACRTLRKK